MNRTPYVVAGAVLAALFAWQSCQLLVRAPSHPRATVSDEDFPLETGLQWVYKAANGFEMVRKLGPVVEEAGHQWRQMQYRSLLFNNDLLMRRVPEGVLGRHLGREQLIMKFPMRTGDSWIIDFPDQELAECTVLEPEDIRALGKTVKAAKVRVVLTNRTSGRKSTNFEWYARDIGLAGFHRVVRFELERFEKAK